MKKKLVTALCLIMIMMTMVAPLSAMAETKVQIKEVNVDGARLREGPGDYPWSCSLKKGTRVFYVGEREGAWCKIYTVNGLTGYVFNEFLDHLGTVDMRQIGYTIASVPIYRLPSTKSGKVSTKAHHDFIVVFDCDGEWAAVRALSGEMGFMQLKYLEPV